MRDILGGAKGPKTDVVLLNAGAAIYTATEGITFEEGIAKAKEVLESGAALEQLQKLLSLIHILRYRQETKQQRKLADHKAGGTAWENI